jgi:hypothetical protein
LDSVQYSHLWLINSPIWKFLAPFRLNVNWIGSPFVTFFSAFKGNTCILNYSKDWVLFHVFWAQGPRKVWRIAVSDLKRKFSGIEGEPYIEGNFIILRYNDDFLYSDFLAIGVLSLWPEIFTSPCVSKVLYIRLTLVFFE